MMQRFHMRVIVPLLLTAIVSFVPLLAHAQGDQGSGIVSQILDFLKIIPQAVSTLLAPPQSFEPLDLDSGAFPGGTTVGGEFGEAVNNPPVIAPIQGRAVIPHVPITFQVIADDLDGDPITYSASNLPPGAQFETVTGVFRWIPRDAHVGTTFQVVVKASDGKAIASRKITIAVHDPSEITSVDLSAGEQEIVTVGGVPARAPTREVGTNHTPTLAFIGDQSVFLGETIKLYLYATDRDQDPITYSISHVPPGGVFNEKLGIFEWTPSVAGSTRFTFSASDGSSDVSETMYINVTEVISARNLPPVIAEVGNLSITAGEPLQFTVSASDPEGGLVLVYKDSVLPPGAAFVNNTFQWTPGNGDAGTHRIIFAASDGVNVVKRQVSITVTAQSGGSKTIAFTSSFSDRTVNEGGSVSFTVSAADAAGTEVVIAAAGLPLGANFVPVSGKPGAYQFSWVPGYSQAGNYSISFMATNGASVAVKAIGLQVNNVNRAPVVSDVSAKNVPENETLSFKVSVSDPDDDQIVCSTVNLPQGAWFDCSTRVFSWKPAFGKAGMYPGVTFTFTDTGGLSASITTAITVTKVNRPPTITLQSPISAAEKETIKINLATFANDPDSDALTYAGVVTTGPVAGKDVSALGATLDAATGAFAWTPSYDQAGSYFVEFTVDDGQAIASATVQFVISNVNRPPVLNRIGSKSVYNNHLLTITLSGSDPDGDPITFSAPVRPAESSFSSPTFTWIPKVNGTYSATFQVSDGAPDASCCTTEVVSITVTTEPTVKPVSILDNVRTQWASLLQAIQNLFRR